MCGSTVSGYTMVPMARDKSAPEGAGKKRRIRTAVFRSIMRVGFLRHFYVRRLLRFMEKSKAKRRTLPPELVRLDQMLSRLPPPKRAEALETALLASPDETPSREMRRAASRQERLRGDGRGGYRPGTAREKPRRRS